MGVAETTVDAAARIPRPAMASRMALVPASCVWLSGVVLGIAVVRGPTAVWLELLLVGSSIAVANRLTGDLFAPPVFAGVLFLIYFPIRSLALLGDSVPATFPFMYAGMDQLVFSTAPLVIAAWAAWLLGYFGAPFRAAVSDLSGRLAVRPLRSSSNRVLALGWIGISARVVTFLQGNTSLGSTIPGAAASYINVATNLPYIAIALLVTGWCRHGQRGVPILLLAVANILSAGLGSSKGNVALAVLSVVVPLHYHRAPFRLRSMVAWTLLVAFILIPAGVAYRGAMANGESGLSAVSATRSALAAPPIADGGGYLQRSLRVASFRLSGVEAVAAARLRTPTEIGFESPREYLAVPAALLLPKAVWPAKPNIGDTYPFALHYLRLPPTAISGVAVTPIGDLWIHGGWISLIAGMLILGWVARWMYEIAAGPSLGEYRGVLWFGLLFFSISWDLTFDLNLARSARALTLVIGSLVLLGYSLRPHGRRTGGLRND